MIAHEDCPSFPMLADDCLSEVLECIPDPALVIDDRGVIEAVNSEATALFGWPGEEFCGLRIESLLPEDVREEHAEFVRRYFAAPSTRPMGQVKRLLGCHSSGKKIPLDISLRPILIAGQLKVLCCPRDVGDRVEREKRIEALARFDGLTGLLNRRAFHEKLTAAIEDATARSQRVALIFIDLDRFKAVNDTYGHVAGDRLIAEVARRLTESVRVTDMLLRSDVRDSEVCRFGGDEFVCLLEEVPDQQTAVRIADRLHSVFREPIDLGGFSVGTSGSIGVAVCPDHASDAESLIRAADFAMYHAKASGGSRVSSFDAKAHREMQTRNEVVAALPGASSRGEMSVVYQPIWSAIDDRIDSFEALVRWQHPELGSVPPLEFIPIAEENGEIQTIGAWVFEEVCRTLSTWRDEGRHLVRVWINWSPVQLRDEANVDPLLETADRYGIPRELLGLEITETAILETRSSSIQTLSKLRAAGFEVRLDDFGTGYSSLVHMSQLPAGGLKIDRSFVQDFESETTRDICKLVVAVADSLGISVTAEGIETVEQADAMRRIGCRYLQGFLLGSPMSALEASSCLDTA